jgi:hypothetical protein
MLPGFSPWQRGTVLGAMYRVAAANGAALDIATLPASGAAERRKHERCAMTVG